MSSLGPSKCTTCTDLEIYAIPEDERPRLSGWRLRLLTISLCICCFLSSLDAIIVSTSIPAIAADLQAFEQSSCMVASYLISYFSFLIIWTKVSDLIGRKPMLITAIIVFLALSGGCGGAETTLQFITQLRVLGGTIGVSIATNLLNSTVQSHLENETPSDNITRNIMQDGSSAETLPNCSQTLILAAFAAGHKQQLLMILGFCAAQFLALALMWEKPLRNFI
ncbi:hypothetical protein BJX76DRAFT_354273 [Aspergillus varians]